MKKVLSIIIALTLFGAQPAKAFIEPLLFVIPIPTIGVKGGYSLSGFTTSNGQMTSRGHIGGFVGLDFIIRLSTRVEVMYSWQGSTFEIPNDKSMSKINLESEYLKIPLTIRYFAHKGLFVETGVSFDIMTKYHISSNSMDNVFTANTLDVSIPVGLGYQFKIDNIGAIDISARYNISTIPIFNELPNIKNSVLSFSVCLTFGGIAATKSGGWY